MMLKTIFSAILLSFCTFNSIAIDLKIAVINASEVESKSLIIRDVTSKVKLRSEKIQKDVNGKEEELKKELQDLEKKRSVVSEQVLLQKQQELQQKVISWQEDLKKDNDALEKAKIESLSEVDSRAKIIIDRIAKDKKIDIVLSSQSVLYSGSDVVTDITIDFISELNGILKTSDFDKIFKKHREGASKK